ncbi:MFS transporter [Carboxylicivirga sp. N1Y90]|uniref:MFS transporter n=1 Tax=Carboxylicivirga fragile TaxID=3417571 RepID=UPI003D353402|nr:MFS transporter [Marinilabiliaceae bacterium N1Y90]
MIKVSEQRMAFFASAQLYLSLSILFGTWVIYIPHITEKLNMSEGQLGVALFFGAFGSLFGTVIGKGLIGKFGEGRVSLVSMMMQSVFMLSMFLAPTFYLLCTGFFLYGFSGGIFQVSVNAMVISIEKKFKVAIMSRCHGFFSLGGLIASGLGTLLLIALDSAVWHIVFSVSVVVILQLVFAKVVLPVRSVPQPRIVQPSSKTKKNGLLICLALIAISVMVTEGAIADWSGLYLQDVVKVNKEWLGLAYAAFSLSMTVGRFVGDFFSRRFGSLQIIIGGFALGLIGFVFVLSQEFYSVVFGFFVIGTGFSIIVPEIYRISANIEGVNSANGIAFMAGAGYVGFLAGPVLLGIVAETFGLSISFMVLFVLVSFGALLATALKISSRLKLTNS